MLGGGAGQPPGDGAGRGEVLAQRGPRSLHLTIITTGTLAGAGRGCEGTLGVELYSGVVIVVGDQPREVALLLVAGEHVLALLLPHNLQ